MESKKDLIGSELMKEIIAIRVDTLWRMLALKKENRLPRIDEEGCTGEFDNKGAMFLPGGFIFQDSDRKKVDREKCGLLSSKDFRKKIRETMRYDNATLFYQDGLCAGVNLANGFFAEMAGRILAIKHEARTRTPMFKIDPPDRITSQQITRSYCPGYITPPYGSRTKLTSCIAVCLIEPGMYYVLGNREFGLRGEDAKALWNGIRTARKPIVGKDDKVLAAPYAVVCHTTRYKKEVLTGITRILGFGKFGEFANFTLEEATHDLLNELEGGKSEFHPNDIFAEYEGIQVVGVLRMYPRTTPGKRLMRTTAVLVSPVKDLELDLEKITKEAKARYNIK